MRRPNAVQPLITIRFGLLVAAARVLGGRDADVERIGRGLRCLAVDKCAAMGLRPSTGNHRTRAHVASLRRSRYAMEWLMSAIFAANTMLAARQSNGPKSMPEI